MLCVGSADDVCGGWTSTMTMTDYYSKFVDFVPLKDIKASGVASIITTFIYWYLIYILISILY